MRFRTSRWEANARENVHRYLGITAAEDDALDEELEEMFALIGVGDGEQGVEVVEHVAELAASDGDSVLVGVLRTARSRSGKSLVDIAALQEHGSRPIVVRLTPRARVSSCGVSPRRPGRTGLKPTGHRHRSQSDSVAPLFGSRVRQVRQGEDVSRRFLERVAALLGGEFGHP